MTQQWVASTTPARLYQISLLCRFVNLIKPHAPIVQSRTMCATSSVIDVVDGFELPRIHVVAYVWISEWKLVASVGILVLQVVPSTLVAIFPVKRGNVSRVFSVVKIVWLHLQ